MESARHRLVFRFTVLVNVDYFNLNKFLLTFILAEDRETSQQDAPILLLSKTANVDAERQRRLEAFRSRDNDQVNSLTSICRYWRRKKTEQKTLSRQVIVGRAPRVMPRLPREAEGDREVGRRAGEVGRRSYSELLAIKEDARRRMLLGKGTELHEGEATEVPEGEGAELSEGGTSSKEREDGEVKRKDSVPAERHYRKNNEYEDEKEEGGGEGRRRAGPAEVGRRRNRERRSRSRSLPGRRNGLARGERSREWRPDSREMERRRREDFARTELPEGEGKRPEGEDTELQENMAPAASAASRYIT